MIEHTELLENENAAAIDVRRTVAPGQFVSYAGSDIARGEVVLRRGTRISSREIGMLAACGIAAGEVVRKPKVAVLSTGDELVPPGGALASAHLYDSNGAIIAAAVAEAGGEPIPFGAFPDEATALELAMRAALEACDMVVLSGGTSKGAGDLSHRIVSKLGRILVHGVALKPGRPLCLAIADGKPLAVLPGFPTSAIFTFHAFVASVIRARAGLPPEAARTVDAEVPVRIPSELGGQEFVLVAPVHLVEPATGIYNAHLLRGGLALVKGWQRMQGFVYRSDDTRFAGKSAADAIKTALADPRCLMVNRNAGAGTRLLIDKLLGGAKPAGYSNQPKSHNAVAASVAQRRAGWGHRHRVGRPPLWARIPADRTRGLRLSAGREPPRSPGGAGLPRGAARR